MNAQEQQQQQQQQQPLVDALAECGNALTHLQQCQELLTNHQAEHDSMKQQVATLQQEKEELLHEIADLKVRLQEAQAAKEQQQEQHHRRQEEEQREQRYDDNASTQSTTVGTLFSMIATEEDFPMMTTDDDESMAMVTANNSIVEHDQEEQEQDTSLPLMSAIQLANAEYHGRPNHPKKSPARKRYSSPKKWRRMIRDHRLQSIFIDA
eukprot:CAMPEP_0168758066 /NCGR_PEP_ID=MMETSP0724-20121128/21500_1 /TAXON_ID=265536 /ORGANISM="Amphiprora sp., Strain CCMP467" /LENGTH=208 /DNA_ID=CAMNT_0008806915 /DNA_START=52 /DNA_END=678 /DNA_ORIENTATION=+